MKANCLLDSRSEGMLISPKFMWATGIKTFALETPIILQLACRGSHSIINYGMNARIKFGHTQHDEYFNVANVEYYDTILGTRFLRKHNIVLASQAQETFVWETNRSLQIKRPSMTKHQRGTTTGNKANHTQTMTNHSTWMPGRWTPQGFTSTSSLQRQERTPSLDDECGKNQRGDHVHGGNLWMWQACTNPWDIKLHGHAVIEKWVILGT